MRVLQQVVGFAGFDVGDEGAQGVEGAGEVVVLLACDGCVGVAVGVGTEQELRSPQNGASQVTSGIWGLLCVITRCRRGFDSASLWPAFIPTMP